MIIYSQEAQTDVDRLFTWLEIRDQGAATRFLATLRQTTKRMASRPLLYPQAGAGSARKCLMRFGGSAYVLYFMIDGADQIIVRIWHGREERR